MRCSNQFIGGFSNYNGAAHPHKVALSSLGIGHSYRVSQLRRFRSYVTVKL